VLALVEFFTDKIPGVDSGWDFLQTLARVPAGAFLAAAALSPAGDLSAGMLATGAGVALGSHALKAGSRVLINASPGPLSCWGATGPEDVAAVGVLPLARAIPLLALGIALTLSLVLALAVWWVWRRVFRRRSAVPAR